MNNIKVPKHELKFIRCEKIILESGKEIFAFYPDHTTRNFFERMMVRNNDIEKIEGS